VLLIKALQAVEDLILELTMKALAVVAVHQPLVQLELVVQKLPAEQVLHLV
tara:strand:- start:243 stop:395 length:153 start_codon:yes stop_codon:yes gene_type:complete